VRIHSESTIHHPRDVVFEAYRDRLPEIVSYLPDIREIVVRDRKESGSVVTLHNEWFAATDVPRVIQSVVKAEMLRWDDFASWEASEYICSWRLRVGAFTEAVHCAGTNTFIADGPSQTRVVLAGELTLDLSSVRGVPRFMAKKIAPQIERFVVAMITPNLQRVNQSLQAFLDAQGGSL
jgi:hypothetical protein